MGKRPDAACFIILDWGRARRYHHSTMGGRSSEPCDRRMRAPLMPVGNAGGNIDCIPAEKDFRDAADFACRCAPMFYPLFPVRPGGEGIFLMESRKLPQSL